MESIFLFAFFKIKKIVSKINKLLLFTIGSCSMYNKKLMNNFEASRNSPQAKIHYTVVKPTLPKNNKIISWALVDNSDVVWKPKALLLTENDNYKEAGYLGIYTNKGLEYIRLKHRFADLLVSNNFFLSVYYSEYFGTGFIKSYSFDLEFSKNRALKLINGYTKVYDMLSQTKKGISKDVSSLSLFKNIFKRAQNSIARNKVLHKIYIPNDIVFCIYKFYFDENKVNIAYVRKYRNPKNIKNWSYVISPDGSRLACISQKENSYTTIKIWELNSNISCFSIKNLLYEKQLLFVCNKISWFGSDCLIGVINSKPLLHINLEKNETVFLEKSELMENLNTIMVGPDKVKCLLGSIQDYLIIIPSPDIENIGNLRVQTLRVWSNITDIKVIGNRIYVCGGFLISIFDITLQGIRSVESYFSIGQTYVFPHTPHKKTDEIIGFYHEKGTRKIILLMAAK